MADRLRRPREHSVQRIIFLKERQKKKIKNKIQHNPGNTGFEWFGESINENDDGVWN